ncbi:MAG TPA: aminoacetone oxidase family FAD-binding enzyme [Thermoanaerobaculia bacterium]|nr:aminoacetone oxidase family FAD-binding enzyme [Thermoanaerobaculia bacterium]
MNLPEHDVAIIGLGAAGLTAAIFAKRAAPHARIIAYDAAPKIGAKILISGGGRCNVTHHAVTAADFNGNRNAIAKVLRTFPVEQTIAWFAELGVTLKREETGKLFPTTDKARTIVDALLRACEGIELVLNARITSLAAIRAKRIILATGGRSVPKTGSDGSGYALAREAGHTITEVFPALVPLVLEESSWMRSLSGTSVEAELSVRSSTGRVLTRQRGSLLFTHFGLSGPVALDVSRHWIAARHDDAGATLVANFLPGESFESIEATLMREKNPRATVASVLRGRMPERLLDVLASPQVLSSLRREDRRRVVRALVETVVPVERDRGFDYAEVTAGGVPLSEVDLSTMQSRKRAGLFLCGEILDVDGRIGGFNFQWAWASGRLAGRSAAAPSA